MKFRSKTGETFENTYDDTTFCGQYIGCINCPVGNVKLNYDCTEWVNENPHEAARLMGYEVVEDEHVGNSEQLEKANMDNAVEGMCCDCAHGGPCCSWDENEDCQYWKEDGTCWVPYTKEETNMDKPRICEVLGVEVNENFKFNDFPFDECKVYFVGTDGEIRNAKGGSVTGGELCYIINNPDRIIHKPRWTEQDKEDALMVKRVFGEHQIGVRRDYLGQLFTIAEKGCPTTAINRDMFPSVKTEQSVKLDEIIGGAE